MERSGTTIIEEWEKVEIPPPPELQQVTVDPETTALLILDIQQQNCNVERRPRCVASVPKIRELLARARGVGMAVVYSLTSTAEVSDVREEVAPVAEESVVKSSVDKFYNTDLEEILQTRGIETVIVAGTSAHGAVLHTATTAALRGLRVIVPVDGLSAGEAYAEQYTCWHLANGPGTRRQAVLTRMDMIDF
ncbi:MAG: cysteine hydrolase [Anaerolineae bacterium]